MLIKNNIERMFSSPEGQNLYKRILSTVEKHNMAERMKSTLLVGFSGGADSVMLLSFLSYYSEKNSSPSIVAVHVNHGIRGADALSDAEFSASFCAELGVVCEVVSIDVPAISKERGIGLEEAARDARYSAFDRIIRGRNDIGAIVLAHNSTDNVETVMLNMLRGSGVRGMCGIPPVRDNIIRPLIEIPKVEIENLLSSFDIPFVIDKTNFDTDISRNFIRHRILPLMREISSSPEDMVGRMTDNMRMASDFISMQAEEVLNSIENPFCFKVDRVRGLHPAIFNEVFSSLVRLCTGISPTEKHTSSVYRMSAQDDFSISLGAGFDFACQRGICTFIDNSKSLCDIRVDLHEGENIIPDTNITVFVEKSGKTDESYSNIYKKVIFKSFSRDIIDNGLYLRFKKDGDSYKYGGITHKLKKVFNDRGIPSFARSRIPVICDSQGILWVPGLSARDGVSNQKSDAVKISICYKESGEYICYDAGVFTDKI